MLFPNYSELSMVLVHNQRNGLNLIMNNVFNFHTFILEPERSAETVKKNSYPPRSHYRMSDETEFVETFQNAHDAQKKVN